MHRLPFPSFGTSTKIKLTLPMHTFREFCGSQCTVDVSMLMPWIRNATIAQITTLLNGYFSTIHLSFQVTNVYNYQIPYNVLHGAAIGNQNEAYIKRVHMGDEKTL